MSTEYLENMNKYIADLTAQIKQIDRQSTVLFAEIINEKWSNQKTIYIMGNGGSAATASHFACDFNKGLKDCRNERLRILCLNDNLPTIMAYANDLSYSDIFVEQLRNFLAPGELVIGISGSGNSSNVLKAISYANDHAADTFALVGYDGGKLKEEAHHSIHIAINDMQIVEDIHMMIVHMTMRVLALKYNAAGGVICQ